MPLTMPEAGNEYFLKEHVLVGEAYMVNNHNIVQQSTSPCVSTSVPGYSAELRVRTLGFTF